MDVCAELLADDAWATEDNNKSFNNVGVNFLVDCMWQDDQYPWPWFSLVLKQKIW